MEILDRIVVVVLVLAVLVVPMVILFILAIPLVTRQMLDLQKRFAVVNRPRIRLKVERPVAEQTKTPTVTRWLKSLIAVLLGNGLYFSLLPHLPPAARHQPLKLDIGVLVDFWFCLFVYGLLEAGAQLSRKFRPRP